MAKRDISNLDLKLKLTKEYLDNGGYQEIWDLGLLEDLKLVKSGYDGKVDPDSVSTRVNAFMLAILASQLTPPFYSPNHISEYETTLQKSNSFDQINIDTVEQFDKIYEEFKSKTDFLFRGQQEAKWRLYGKLQRKWISDKLTDKFNSYQSLLKELVDSGRAEYKERYIELLGEKHDDADNDIAVLSFLQHHGCPTPLLDWTYKLQNALFFAIDGLENKVRNKEIDDYFSVYFIEEKNFEKGGMRNLIYQSIDNSREFTLNKLIELTTNDEALRDEMREFFKGRKAIDKKRIKGSGMIAYMLKLERIINVPVTYFADGKTDDITFSLNNSINIQNQSGVFTWNSDPTKPFELVVNELNIEANKENNPDNDTKNYVLCECFNINKKLTDYIRRTIEQDGITKDFIYSTPDTNTWKIYENCIAEKPTALIGTNNRGA
jgi:hypothetical protein